MIALVIVAVPTRVLLISARIVPQSRQGIPDTRGQEIGTTVLPLRNLLLPRGILLERVPSEGVLRKPIGKPLGGPGGVILVFLLAPHGVELSVGELAQLGL